MLLFVQMNVCVGQWEWHGLPDGVIPHSAVCVPIAGMVPSACSSACRGSLASLGAYISLCLQKFRNTAVWNKNPLWLWEVKYFSILIGAINTGETVCGFSLSINWSVVFSVML